MLDLKNIIKQKHVFFVFIFVLFVFLSILSYSVVSNSIDPDFGWHLRSGQLILERGVPKIDWYSYTMANFLWINHEWLTDVFIYKIYSLLGYAFLTAVFLSIYTLAFIILIKKDRFFYHLLPVCLGYLATLGFLGIRPQLFSVFFVAIILIILNKFLENQSTKLIYFCPIIFLIWANIHGGFIIGLLFIFLFLALEIFRKTKLFRKIISLRFFSGQKFIEPSIKKIKVLSVLFIFSIFFTFINPYGLRLYEEVFRTAIDSFLKFHIVEWMPLFSSSSFQYAIFKILYIGIFLGFLIVFYKKIDFDKIILSLMFLLFAISSQRNFLIFTILTIPIFAELLFYYKNTEIPQQVKIIFGGFRKWIVALVVFGLFVYGFYPYFIDNIRARNYNLYPEKAVGFLRTLPASKNLLNEYNWGGYLIWKLPERKVFIDGRMPSWRDNGQFVFEDYIKIMKAQDEAKELLEKYNIRIVLLNKNKEEQAIKYINYQVEPKNQLMKFFEKNKWPCKVFGVCLPAKNIYNELTDSGWRIVYKDDVAIILER